jgi:hypothetical protein
MIWIEILSRHKDVLARVQSRTDGVAIGRGYENTVIVDDPYVAPQHLRVFRDAEGHLVAEDLGTHNGLYDEAGTRHAAIRLSGNTLIRIGQTWLRAREAGFEVAAEQKLQSQKRLWPWLLALLILAPVAQLLTTWAQNVGENEMTTYLSEVLFMLMAIGIWAGFWSLVSRLFSGFARVALHAMIALTGFTLMSALAFFRDWAVFAFSSPVIARYGFTVFWLWLATVCFCHLYVISAKRLRYKAIIVFSLAIGAGLAQWMLDDPFKPENRIAQSPYLHRTFPASWRMVAPKTEMDFVEELKKIEDALKQLREEETAEDAEEDDAS